MASYYEMLELVPTATDAEIRRAYKKLSLKYHPDKNSNSIEATNKFKQICEAYQVLSDQIQRLTYDKKLRHDARRTTHHHRWRSATDPFSTSPFFKFKSAHDIFHGFFKDEENTGVRSKHFGQNITRQANDSASNRKEPRNFMSFMWDPFETFTEINTNNNIINNNNNNKNAKGHRFSNDVFQKGT
ncbi:dnaJ homolog subfamily B member 8-like isoform X2 [Contarinia nasturtii]|uniref:dnaJ homolog subfamily B member 8-like isoform X2 n=1 Tax=Contarinia nasturtii TaxID=265458 RepID=UPI0012D3AB17|nr:dnaJ homolog subfamily B member 8-like isoform X2 [Contarinia nasturtii]